MSAVIRFPDTPDAAWNRYERLAKAALAEPSLMTSRAHVEATLRAHRAFCEAFNRESEARQ